MSESLRTPVDADGCVSLAIPDRPGRHAVHRLAAATNTEPLLTAQGDFPPSGPTGTSRSGRQEQCFGNGGAGHQSRVGPRSAERPCLRPSPLRPKGQSYTLKSQKK